MILYHFPASPVSRRVRLARRRSLPGSSRADGGAGSTRHRYEVLSLGWTLPTALSDWAEQHRQRSDVGTPG